MFRGIYLLEVEVIIARVSLEVSFVEAMQQCNIHDFPILGTLKIDVGAHL